MPRTLEFPEPGRVVVRDLELPDPEPGQVRLRTRLTLISTGTETTILGHRFAPGTHWDRWFRWPHRPGYCCVADVEAVTPDCGLAVGDRVVVMASHASHHVVDASRCTVVPGEISDEQAVWFALAKVAFVGAEASGVRLGGGRALVVGAGPIGQLATRWLAAAGASEVLVLSRVGGLRLDLALAGGATAVAAGDLAAGLDAMVPDGAARPEVVVDSTGNADVLAEALPVVADRGRVVILGDPGDPARQHLTPDLITRGLSVVGAHGNHVRGEREHEVRRLFFALVASGRIGLDGLVTHRFEPERAVEAYRLIEDDREHTMGVTFSWNDR